MFSVCHTNIWIYNLENRLPNYLADGFLFITDNICPACIPYISVVV